MMVKKKYADGITTFADPIVHIPLIISLCTVLHALMIKTKTFSDSTLFAPKSVLVDHWSPQQ